MKITASNIHGVGNLNSFIDSKDFERTVVIKKESVEQRILTPNNSTPTQCKIKGTINTWQGMVTEENFNVELFDINGGTIGLYSKTTEGQLRPTSLSVTVTKEANYVKFVYSLMNPNRLDVSTVFEMDITIIYDSSREDIIFTDQAIDFYKQVNYNKNVLIGGDVSIGGSLTIPSDKSVTINELQSGSISIHSMTGGEIGIDNLLSGNVYIDKLGYYMNPINITHHDLIPNYVNKDSFQPHVFYRIKYKAEGTSTFNNAVIMIETTNSMFGSINIGATTKNSDRVLMGFFINSDAQVSTWDDCSYIVFLAMNSAGEVEGVSEIMEVNLIPLHLSFRTMFDE